MAVRPIERVEVFDVQLPMARSFTLSSGGVGDGATLPRLFIRITDKDGVAGWGEVPLNRRWAGETRVSAVHTIRDVLGPMLTGRSPADLRAIHQLMDREIAQNVSRGQPLAKSGIDMALHDLLARQLGVPLRVLFGADTPSPVSLSWTVAVSFTREVEAVVAEGLAEGYKHFNVKVGAGVDVDTERLKRVRQLAPEAIITADANRAYDLYGAVALARKMEPLGIRLFEQPLESNDWHGFRQLRRRSPVPIGMDESLVHPRDLMHAVRLEALDVLIVKVSRSGGLLPSCELVQLARAAGLDLMPSGLTETSLGLMASAQLVSALGPMLPAAFNGPQFLAGEITEEPLPRRGGEVTLPADSGIGLHPSLERLKELAR